MLVIRIYLHPGHTKEDIYRPNFITGTILRLFPKLKPIWAGDYNQRDTEFKAIDGNAWPVDFSTEKNKIFFENMESKGFFQVNSFFINQNRILDLYFSLKKSNLAYNIRKPPIVLRKVGNRTNVDSLHPPLIVTISILD